MTCPMFNSSCPFTTLVPYSCSPLVQVTDAGLQGSEKKEMLFLTSRLWSNLTLQSRPLHSLTALLRVCSMLCHSSTPTGCVQAAFQSTVTRLRDFTVITESSGMAASENLWSVDFRPGSAHNDGLFMRLSEIGSGVFYSEINQMF